MNLLRQLLYQLYSSSKRNIFHQTYNYLENSVDKKVASQLLKHRMISLLTFIFFAIIHMLLDDRSFDIVQ